MPRRSRTVRVGFVNRVLTYDPTEALASQVRDALDVSKRHGKVLRLEDMPPEKREEMERLYNR